MALGWGRGERLFRLPSLPAVAALVAIPPFGVSTPEAYQQIDAAARETARGSIALDHAALETWGSVARLGGNDFESVLFSSEPRLRSLFERMAETRPFLVRLSGSGSAIVALYKSPEERDRAAGVLDQRQATLIKTATRDRPPAPPA
jgi:4-diphosphocytidyl-2-C-methyl-D-erythritol kinase